MGSLDITSTEGHDVVDGQDSGSVGKKGFGFWNGDIEGNDSEVKIDDDVGNRGMVAIPPSRTKR